MHQSDQDVTDPAGKQTYRHDVYSPVYELDLGEVKSELNKSDIFLQKVNTEVGLCSVYYYKDTVTALINYTTVVCMSR